MTHGKLCSAQLRSPPPPSFPPLLCPCWTIQDRCPRYKRTAVPTSCPQQLSTHSCLQEQKTHWHYKVQGSFSSRHDELFILDSVFIRNLIAVVLQDSYQLSNTVCHPGRSCPESTQINFCLLYQQINEFSLLSEDSNSLREELTFITKEEGQSQKKDKGRRCCFGGRNWLNTLPY